MKKVLLSVALLLPFTASANDINDELRIQCHEARTMFEEGKVYETRIADNISKLTDMLGNIDELDRSATSAKELGELTDLRKAVNDDLAELHKYEGILDEQQNTLKELYKLCEDELGFEPLS